MTTVFLSPVGGVAAQFFDNNGNVLTGGKLYSYAAGTTTPQATYITNAGTVVRTNPIILDSAGRVGDGGEIWLDGALQYKFVLKTALDVLIATWDNVWGIGSANGTAVQVPIIFNSTGTGSTVSFALGGSPTNENTTNVYINGVYQQKNTYLLSGANLVFSEAPPITSNIEVTYV
jgi:hypothetical protein